MQRDPAKGARSNRVTRMRYDVGPMGFLGDQIQKEMDRAGYPVKEHCLHRGARAQNAAFERKASKARAFQSAHQFYGAGDYVHEKWFWFAKKNDDGSPTGAPDGTMFFDALWDCVALVSEKYGVEFAPRLSWDAAHVELANWRVMRDRIGERKPNSTDLRWYFAFTLPRVWKAHEVALRNKMLLNKNKSLK